MKKALTLFFISVSLFGKAHFFYLPAGSYAIATGNQVSNSSNVFSAQNNAAGLGFVKQYGFGISAERRFLVAGLDLLNASIALPTKTGTFGISANYFGSKSYNEKMIGLAFGKAFGKKFSTGLKFNYLNYAIAEYGQRNLFTFDIGVQYLPIEKLLIGAQVFNPLPIELENITGEKIPTIIRIGAAYTPSKKISLLAEIEKDLIFKPNIKVGLDYRIAEKFALRGGINSYPLRGTFGFGVNTKGLSIDASAVYHGTLGITPQVSISWVFNKKNSASN